MNEKKQLPAAVNSATIPARTVKSLYPAQFAAQMEGRTKHVLGDLFGLKNFGVNLTRLVPGGISALRHAHSQQDEFIYVLSGCGVLITDEGETPISTGMCAGFPAGTGNAHQIRNTGTLELIFLEVGDRSAGDEVTYPDDDLMAQFVSGSWQFTHKDGSEYPSQT